ncbi:hypothetical protein CFBP3846_P400009 (plasmid) [Pseudomonas syringae pv. avii]|uniref:DUF1534 domain-containing protein n=1 Tax=Pseudomonas syringae pv. avii TaxID=663959 RepID=A0ABY1UG98_PSESX|nr:hypothetical protein ALQ24_200038 [Pseudomonas syringae pv. antirrhini]SOS30852.1 hypothetical protein CFBP3846_P400009 [Pseudomonas syringae pv. avii]
MSQVYHKPLSRTALRARLWDCNARRARADAMATLSVCRWLCSGVR